MRIERWNTIPQQFKSNECENTNCDECECYKNVYGCNNSMIFPLLIILLIQKMS